MTTSAQHGPDGLVVTRRGLSLPPLGAPSTRALQRAVAVAIVPLAAVTVLLAATSDHLERPAATAVYRTYMAVVPMLVGLYWWRRRSSSRFGLLLIGFGLSAWVMSWQSSDSALAFDVGVLAEAPYAILTFWLFLAFPSGRLGTRAARVLLGAWVAAALAFFVPWALFTPVIAGADPLSSCVPACPANALQVGSANELVEVAGRWEGYALLVLTVAVLVVYAARLRTASRPRRRALIAVAASSLLFLPVFFAYHFSRLILELDPATLEAMSWVLIGLHVVLPLGFLAALFQADLFAGFARGRLLEELVTKPSPERWRDAVAHALHDPAARIAYWDPGSSRYRQPDGAELGPLGQDRARADVERGDRLVAVLDVDSALAEDPELLLAATSATALAIESGDLEGELRDSRARILAAGDDERRRIERDLHDSAQQRLVALRIHLALASETIESATQRRRVELLGDEVDGALDDLRSVARGVYPVLLGGGGIAAALRAFARHGTLPVSVEGDWCERPDQEVERAAYFCCLEALQNAAKHAGAGAAVMVRLTEADACVGFTVEDDGAGFDPATVDRGAGLDNIADRVSAAGGTVRIDSARGRGTRIVASFAR